MKEGLLQAKFFLRRIAAFNYIAKLAHLAVKVFFIFIKANDDKNIIDNLHILLKRFLVPFIEWPLSKSKRISALQDE